MRFRKRPLEIEALQWTGENRMAMRMFLNGDMVGGVLNLVPGDDYALIIHTLEGTVTATPGDWIIRGIEGEYYPCHPRIFDATYERVDE